MMAAVVRVAITAPWDQAILLCTVAVGWMYGACPLTSLENVLREAAGWPRIKGFMTHYGRWIRERLKKPTD